MAVDAGVEFVRQPLRIFGVQRTNILPRLAFGGHAHQQADQHGQQHADARDGQRQPGLQTAARVKRIDQSGAHPVSVTQSTRVGCDRVHPGLGAR